MSARRVAAALLALTLRAPQGFAQGAVQEDPRRPPPPQDTPGCEIWEGTIVGNDPSAIAYFQLCGGDDVTGMFMFTSLRSGWSRHRLAGTWTDQHSVIVLRDLGMDESHPLNGWSLCAADTYNLRITRPGHIDGTFDSAQCSDHGRVVVDLTHPNAPPGIPPPPVLPRTPAPSRSEARRSRRGCSVRGDESVSVGASGVCGWGLAACAMGTVRRARTRRRS